MHGGGARLGMSKGLGEREWLQYLGGIGETQLLLELLFSAIYTYCFQAQLWTFSAMKNYYYYSRFIDEKTDSQEREVTYPKSPCW